MRADKVPEAEPTARVSNSIRAKAQWANPEFRAKMAIAQNKRWAKPEERAKMRFKRESRVAVPEYVMNSVSATCCIHCGNSRIDDLQKIRIKGILGRQRFKCSDAALCVDRLVR